MTRLFPICLATLLLSGGAYAQNESINPDAGDPGDGTRIVVPQRTPAKPKPASQDGRGANEIKIDAEACRYAVSHVPSTDTEYKPGVDADGNAVAPADLENRSQIQFPSQFSIPITANLARGLHLPMGMREDAYVGLVSVDNGRLSFNGQPIGDESDADLAAACARQAKEAH